ncbi:hypothetical protein RHMOL_Rhmol09G0078100 [Rhododendron molle]|uniref:Uncharacterized protein n=1 Tax=Rhododendron molle TaxID=49168 RepID=A0ACC0MB55_RHOML|nr:hypothetical protein RHMOL_Rhmol09G0078100 [Rhododendron molle]
MEKLRLFAGDWSEVRQILPYTWTNEKEQNCCPLLDQPVGYDIILVAEAVYSLSALPQLYELIKKVVCYLLSNSFQIGNAPFGWWIAWRW